MKVKFCLALIGGLISFFASYAQNSQSLNSANSSFSEIDSLNVVAQNFLKVNLTSAKETAVKANKYALENGYLHGYIYSTCIISVTKANTSDCRGALKS
ncbi:MAG: hypothetical protein IPP71_07770 [Bacteroidetes bacterium]|nr:hypothetical protein [Bacteroidota bacterium]